MNLASGVSDSRISSASSTVAPLLRVCDLSVDYATVGGEIIPALRQVDLELCEKEVLGVLGVSGSGKSSLSRAILRLLPANAKVVGGSVEYRGRDLLNMPPRDLGHVRGAGIALISQEPALALNPVLPIGRQIVDVLRAHRRGSYQEGMEQTRAMLREVGFTDPERVLRAYPHQLSGGQRQRAAIAQALICSPSLLIADEPLSSLDTVTQAEILDLLKRLQVELNLAMIFVSHNAGVLSSLADRVIVLHEGHVRTRGSLDQLSREDDSCVRALIYPEKNLVAEKILHPDKKLAAMPCKPVPSPASFLQVRNLSKQFAVKPLFSRKKVQVQALENINFEIHEGATVAVIGRSGSGKTTLARCIAGFETPDQGEIIFANPVPSRDRRTVQLMFQDAGTSLNPRFTAVEVIAEPLDITSRLTVTQRMERALQLMEEVGLDPAWGARKVNEFSGGQRQRLALARALAAAPRLLILDESLSGLDLPLQAQILRLLMNLQARHGLTYLHITHDLNFLPLFADEVFVMDAGKIVERSTPAALLESSHPATRALIEASERLHVPGLEVVL
jgi:ABC-type glutathione transport system ATPase component